MTSHQSLYNFSYLQVMSLLSVHTGVRVQVDELLMQLRYFGEGESQ